MYIIARRININAALQKKTNKNIQVSWLLASKKVKWKSTWYHNSL
jgi:hypothetical protein